MILVNFVVGEIASRPDNVARTITRGPLLDTVSRNATRFIVFDSLNAYNFGARLVGNVVDSLGCT